MGCPVPTWDSAPAEGLALGIARVPALQGFSVENTPMFVQIAEGPGNRNTPHPSHRSTRAKLASFGLQDDERERVHRPRAGL